VSILTRVTRRPESALAGEGDGPGTAPGRPGRPFPPLVYAGLLAASWLVPVLTHLAGADILLLLLLVIGAGSLLRAGDTLLDRLMITVALLIGLAMPAGVLFTVWPWGMDPVPVAGGAFTVLVAVAWFTRRRPALPRRLQGTDLALLAGAAASCWVVWTPTRGKSTDLALIFTSAREDRFNHYSLFDTIHRLGGFTWFQQAHAQVSTSPPMDLYPPGMHYLYALLDTFVRSDTNPGPGLDTYHRYNVYTILGYGFLTLCVAWGARWVAGPWVLGWRRTGLVVLVATMLTIGQMTTLFWQGFDAEVFGLAVMALAIALIVRPPRNPREQVLIAAALVIGASFAYVIYVIVVAIAVVLAAWHYRRRLLAIRWFTLGTLVVAAPFAALPVLMPRIKGYNENKQLLAWGGIIPFNRFLAVGLALVVISSLATRTGRRLPQWWIMAELHVLMAVVLLAFGYYQHEKLGYLSYYWEKLLHAAFVVTLVGIGALALFLNPAPNTGKVRTDWRAQALPSLGIGAAALVLAGGLPLGSPTWSNWHLGPNTQWGQIWMKGDIRSPYATAAAVLHRRGYLGDGTATVVIAGNVGHDNRHLSILEGVLNRDHGRYREQINRMEWINGLGAVTLDPKTGQPSLAVKEAINTVEYDVIMDSPGPLRLAVADPTVADTLEKFVITHDLRYPVTVEYVPGIKL
jgi:hypothetical protein